jgi:NADH:ubiquinone oxidoreductase subunit 2 (subunit N)
MKKILLIPFLLSFHFAYAGTGSGNDETLFILSIIAVMLSILAVLYSIDFIRRIIKERKEKKINHLADNANSENIS